MNILNFKTSLGVKSIFDEAAILEEIPEIDRSVLAQKIDEVKQRQLQPLSKDFEQAALSLHLFLAKHKKISPVTGLQKVTQSFNKVSALLKEIPDLLECTPSRVDSHFNSIIHFLKHSPQNAYTKLAIHEQLLVLKTSVEAALKNIGTYGNGMDSEPPDVIEQQETVKRLLRESALQKKQSLLQFQAGHNLSSQTLYPLYVIFRNQIDMRLPSDVSDPLFEHWATVGIDKKSFEKYSSVIANGSLDNLIYKRSMGDEMRKSVREAMKGAKNVHKQLTHLQGEVTSLNDTLTRIEHWEEGKLLQKRLKGRVGTAVEEYTRLDAHLNYLMEQIRIIERLT